MYGLYLTKSLLGFGMGIMLAANFHICGIKSSFDMLLRNVSPGGPMWFM